ncbi:bifunctional molybdopterin-guanine dinucleotide biosynthesis adaptor protein MobB/molybdopterin molybdotransferase MoeA [Neptunomonas qingdaonensis]|uniref:Molybdopterin molybdenumtransferase n=1 Tax=Neptunomonas qingdaonensis TaxID=1045558 RepID=A0A1I2RE19_9GAMM|nr:bifunctional molybdopterin-guanine dinucleotide biosynthesis adaptor protein MobB/molybdopterin molybdotransferase MoeA [Neptunomonas qingdaonensis]SFG38965.1 molybdopterin molybdotransferase [Neptunomonas qingdaonensis]
MSDAINCFDPLANPGGMLTVAESVARILAQIATPAHVEMIPLSQAINRVLAEDQVSAFDVPQQTNSAMDGYAICAKELSSEKNASQKQHTLTLVGQVLAGGAYAGTLAAGEAVEIMTGAALPAGADSIVIREAVTRESEKILFSDSVKIGQHVRQKGEDIKSGSVALSAGSLIRPQEQGLLASLGMQHVVVFKPLRVAIFSTGDEVVAQGQALPENCIYDTNRFTLTGLLQRMGCSVVDLGIIEDSQVTMQRVLSEASQQADMIISSGGVSMGQADYIKQALEAVGDIGFWRVAMRPGRPLAFGRVGQAPFFGLPGNPVAVMVTFLQFVQPALRKMMGQRGWQPIKMMAVAEEKIKSRAGRIDYSRGVYRINDQGELVVQTTGAQGSGILTSMVQANCLIEIGEQYSQVEAGDRVLIQPFSDLL